MRLLTKFTAAAIAMVLTGGIAAAAQDYAVAATTGDMFRIAQVTDLQADGKSRVDAGNEAAPGQNAETGHKCPMADGECPHMKDGKCPMGEGNCPHMQHGKDGMGGDPANMGKPHKCPMADGELPAHAARKRRHGR